MSALESIRSSKTVTRTTGLLVVILLS